MATAAEPTDAGKRTLEVRTSHDGVFRIEIDPTWKVTFSKVNPQAGGYECMALRIYESDEKQRACFTNVTSFRDLSIPIVRRVKKTKTKAESENNSRKRTASRVVEHDYEWVDDSEAGDDMGPF
jgi:hypothetical protein